MREMVSLTTFSFFLHHVRDTVRRQPSANQEEDPFPESNLTDTLILASQISELREIMFVVYITQTMAFHYSSQNSLKQCQLYQYHVRMFDLLIGPWANTYYAIQRDFVPLNWEYKFNIQGSSSFFATKPLPQTDLSISF